jgi:UDP-N-acetylmuramyl tripeptide synthase
MGEIADQNADYAIVTSDNRAKEDPDAISPGGKRFPVDHYKKIVDRTAAITCAIELARPRDLILMRARHEKLSGIRGSHHVRDIIGATRRRNRR